MKVKFQNKIYEKNKKKDNGLGRFCYDVFKLYVENNSKQTYQDLQKTFNPLHKEFSGENSKKKVVFNKNDFDTWFNDKDNKDNDKHKRYFGYGEYGNPIEHNNEEIYFTTQWGNKKGEYGNINTFIDFVQNTLNYKIEVIDDRENNIMLEETKERLQILKIKNIILYGSPGVGKTHNTNKVIHMIENGHSEQEIFNAIGQNKKSETKDISNIKDRVKFITFHQSFGYEDFIEGYRPNEEGDIELTQGIFRSICQEASKNQNKSIQLDKLIFEDAFELLLKDKIENDDLVKINLNRTNSFYEIFDYNQKSIYYTRQGRTPEEKYHSLSILTLKTMYENENIDIITGGRKTYYRPLLKKLLQIGKNKHIEKVKRKNYYLIIDEINRGNISKIFGELITLIEEDKRDKLEVTLPYSKEPFKVPSNLYIIGTMNSTDKSIALIDIALRRRFTFLKMKPNPELVPEESRELFEQLNEQISQTLGEDYQIGHSYFMNDSDLDFVLNYKIKPLLEEYFYGDEEGLKNILEILPNE